MSDVLHYRPARSGTPIDRFDRITLDSPPNRNALSLRMLDGLASALAASTAGAGRGLLLTHTGSVFCSGVDLKERRALGPDDDAHSRRFGELLLALWDYPRPLVVAVDGAVRGGGMGLLACADVVLASAASTFAYSETRVGVAPALVMAVTLPTVPPRRLTPLLLSGETFDAARALDLGLVTRIEADPRDTGLDAASDRLAAGAPHAQESVKRSARADLGIDLGVRLARATHESAALFAGAEAREGMAAFAQKRPPSWRG